MIDKQDIEQKHENGQYAYFNTTWNSRWYNVFPGQNELKNKILELKYDSFYDINNAFGKLDKALQISDFLYKLGQSKLPQDTEKIRITTLVSCAEAVYRINKPTELISENLVKGFLKPVKEKLDYKIRGHIGEMPYKKTFEPAEVIYLIRNDYIHNGNFTGTFFRNPQAESHVYNIGSFYYTEKEDKTKLIQVTSECKLTYQEFVEIFLKAFIENIEKYCSGK